MGGRGGSLFAYSASGWRCGALEPCHWRNAAPAAEGDFFITIHLLQYSCEGIPRDSLKQHAPIPLLGRNFWGFSSSSSSFYYYWGASESSSSSALLTLSSSLLQLDEMMMPVETRSGGEWRENTASGTIGSGKECLEEHILLLLLLLLLIINEWQKYLQGIPIHRVSVCLTCLWLAGEECGLEMTWDVIMRNFPVGHKFTCQLISFINREITRECDNEASFTNNSHQSSGTRGGGLFSL